MTLLTLGCCTAWRNNSHEQNTTISRIIKVSIFFSVFVFVACTWIRSLLRLRVSWWHSIAISCNRGLMRAQVVTACIRKCGFHPSSNHANRIPLCNDATAQFCATQFCFAPVNIHVTNTSLQFSSSMLLSIVFFFIYFIFVRLPTYTFNDALAITCTGKPSWR